MRRQKRRAVGTMCHQQGTANAETSNEFSDSGVNERGNENFSDADEVTQGLCRWNNGRHIFDFYVPDHILNYVYSVRQKRHLIPNHVRQFLTAKGIYWAPISQYIVVKQYGVSGTVNLHIGLNSVETQFRSACEGQNCIFWQVRMKTAMCKNERRVRTWSHKVEL